MAQELFWMPPAHLPGEVFQLCLSVGLGTTLGPTEYTGGVNRARKS